MKNFSAWPGAFVCGLLVYVEYIKNPLFPQTMAVTRQVQTPVALYNKLYQKSEKIASQSVPLSPYFIQTTNKLGSPTVVAATAFKICAQNRPISHVFIYCEQT